MKSSPSDIIRRKITVLTLQKLKKENKKAVYITAYDYPFARLCDRAGVDIILVGDSLGMTTLGFKTTLPVTMDDMVRHTAAVTRAVKNAFVIGDMPYMSYQPSDRDAVINAGRLISEGGCEAVKCEGGRRVASRIKAIVDAGIPVQGHIGLTPQNMSQQGGYRVQGKTESGYKKLLDDALALQDAGAFSILFEAMPPSTALRLKKRLKIPVYGIGAGDKVDGQLVIIHDILGLFEEFTPKFIKRYCDAGTFIQDAIVNYASDVRTHKFPAKEHFYEFSTKIKKSSNSRKE